MGNDDTSMRVDFSLRRSKSLSQQARSDAKVRTTEPVVFTGSDRLSYGGKKCLTSSVALVPVAGSPGERLQNMFAKSRADLYKRLIEWFDASPCNCGGESSDG